MTRERSSEPPGLVNVKANNDPEWPDSGTNNFGVVLTLGKFYDVDAGSAVQPCIIKLLAVATPLNNGAATPYAVPLSDFAIIQAWNSSGISTVAALASAPVSQIACVPAGNPPVYPTTLALTGGISFRP